MNGCEQLLSHVFEVPWQRFGMLHRFLRYVDDQSRHLLQSALDNILHIVFLAGLIYCERKQKAPHVSTILLTYFFAWFATAGTRRIKSFRGCDDFEL